MTRTTIALVLALACGLAGAATVSARPANAPPCTPKVTKTGGKVTTISCEPATAQITLKGKTYKFKNGFCDVSKSANGALQLSLGTLILNAKGDAGNAYMSFLLRKVGGKLSGSVFEADFGGKEVLGDSLINAKGSNAKGTFTSQFSIDGAFTGSWNCHGVVWNSP